MGARRRGRPETWPNQGKWRGRQCPCTLARACHPAFAMLPRCTGACSAWWGGGAPRTARYSVVHRWAGARAAMAVAAAPQRLLWMDVDAGVDDAQGEVDIVRRRAAAHATAALPPRSRPPPHPPTLLLAALMLVLAAAPAVRLVGVSAVAGNVGVEQVARNVARVLELCNAAASVPLYVGAHEPLLAPPADATFVRRSPRRVHACMRACSRAVGLLLLLLLLHANPSPLPPHLLPPSVPRRRRPG